MDDVINLVSSTYTYDKYGNRIYTKTYRQVFCKVRSISRSEFYQAAQNDLHPEYVFVISHYKDYQGESEITYRPWGSNADKTYKVVRTYRNAESDELELVVEEKIGNA